MHRPTTMTVAVIIVALFALLATVGPLPAQQWADHGPPPAVTSAALAPTPVVKQAPTAVLRASGINLGMGENLIGNASGDSFATFWLNQPQIVSSAGTLTLDSSGAEIIDGDASTLLVITPAGALYEIDTGSGAASYVATAQPFGTEDFSALAEDPTDGTLYAASTSCAGSSLYTLDPETGTATRIGPISVAPCLVAMACNAAGQLYGVDISLDMLVAIDSGTAGGSLVGSLGFDANYSQGMDFDPDKDTCYLFTYNDGPKTNRCELRTCMVGSGDTAAVGPLGSDGMACFGGAAVAGLFSDGFETGNTSRWTNTVP